jgi:hypothetical protein
MAGRQRATFQKRQKEARRLEKARMKAEKRAAKRAAKSQMDEPETSEVPEFPPTEQEASEE